MTRTLELHLRHLGGHHQGLPHSLGADVVYTVDALQRTLTRASGGATTSYTFRGTGEEIAKAQVGTGTPTCYAYSPGGPLATRSGTTGSSLRCFIRDLHGDVVGVAATSGGPQMKGTILYSPWGSPGPSTGSRVVFPQFRGLR